MKLRPLVLLTLLTPMLFASMCGGEKPPMTKEYHDSIVRADSIARRYTLENLLDLKSEQELVKTYGQEAVAYDTIWGAEGFFTMGTVMRTDSLSWIEFYWLNDSLRTGLVSVTLVSESDWYGSTVPMGTWRSSTGLRLGMMLEEVEKINGRPFTFSGFGWDYAGGLISWENGTLDNKGISIQVSEGTGYDTLPLKDYAAILGDVPVSSSDLTARKSGARIWSISVAKVR